MLTPGVINYVAAVYGVLVGIFLPLIYLHGRLHFRKNKFGFRALLAYLGRLAIILVLYSVLVGAFLGGVSFLQSADGIDQIADEIIDTPWYMAGFLIGLLAGIASCVVGFRQARKQDHTRKKQEPIE